MGMIHPSGSVQLNRATPARARYMRALLASAVLAAALTLGGCFGEEGYDIPGRAMKELSPQMLNSVNNDYGYGAACASKNEVGSSRDTYSR